ncbi:MAG: DUF971 domain-containing protein [Planctomycetota bacterium]
MAHQPLQFGPHKPSDEGGEIVAPLPPGLKPLALDLKKDTALTIRWSDGRVSVYPVAYLRRMSPSAEAKALREQLEANPLTVLPSAPPPPADDRKERKARGDTGGKGDPGDKGRPGDKGHAGGGGGFAAESAELVGHYAVRLVFSDGHRTGLYTWAYLREIDPDRAAAPPP